MPSGLAAVAFAAAAPKSSTANAAAAYPRRPAYLAKHTAPSAVAPAAARTVDVMSVRSSSQMMARQPRAAPTRSAPYSTPIAARVRVKARLTTRPDSTKGIVRTSVEMANAASSDTEPPRTAGNGMTRFVT